MEPQAPVIRRGIIQAFDAPSWTATVQVLPSQGNYLTNIQVAKHVLAAEILPGDQCAVLFFDELNPADALIIAVYHIPSAAPVPPVTSLAGGVGGTPLTGDVVLVPGASGTVTITESGQQIVIDASSGSGSVPLVSTNSSTVTINDTSQHTLQTLSFSLASSSTVLILGTIHFKYGASNAGLHVYFFLDGTQIGPVAPVAGNADPVSQTSEAQQFTCAFYQIIASGSHTLTLVVSEALSSSTASIYWSQLAMKA
ncbi:MAG TPA: hypothetical protein VH540_28085 [Ktedonobacterales bacterium]|jgi:hypothetical protein